MVLNPRKRHCLIINKDIANESIELGKTTLPAYAQQKRLGLIKDKDLNFQSLTKLITKTANQKFSDLIRVAPLMNDFNKNIIFNPNKTGLPEYSFFWWGLIRSPFIFQEELI